MAKLNIISAEAVLDGGGMVRFDVEAQDDLNNPVPGLHMSVDLSAADVSLILAEPTAAAKKLMAAQKIAQAQPAFEDANIEARLNSNNGAAQQAANAVSQFSLPIIIEAV